MLIASFIVYDERVKEKARLEQYATPKGNATEMRAEQGKANVNPECTTFPHPDEQLPGVHYPHAL